jgi:hypothetical protein
MHLSRNGEVVDDIMIIHEKRGLGLETVFCYTVYEEPRRPFTKKVNREPVWEKPKRFDSALRVDGHDAFQEGRFVVLANVHGRRIGAVNIDQVGPERVCESILKMLAAERIRLKRITRDKMSRMRTSDLKKMSEPKRTVAQKIAQGGGSVAPGGKVEMETSRVDEELRVEASEKDLLTSRRDRADMELQNAASRTRSVAVLALLNAPFRKLSGRDTDEIQKKLKITSFMNRRLGEEVFLFEERISEVKRKFPHVFKK